jgi:hypothetical protein
MKRPYGSFHFHYQFVHDIITLCESRLIPIVFNKCASTVISSAAKRSREICQSPAPERYRAPVEMTNAQNLIFLRNSTGVNP